MLKQRGIIAVMYLWIAGGLAVAFLGLGVAVKVQTSRLAAAKAETVAVQGRFDLFKSEVKTMGEQQAEKAKAADLANKQLKEKADAQTVKAKSDLDRLYSAYRSLREQRNNPGSGAMPAAPTVTSSTARTCFDTTKLAGAMGILEAGVPRITEQGDVARLRLATAADWAQSLAK